MSSSVKLSSKRRMNGPIAALALLSLALPRRSAERPSTSRRFTSLPRAAPTMAPLAATTSTTSGSGLFQRDIGWMPTSARWPTAAIGGALVKTSASGPMPTSRYCDHMPFWMRRSFSAIACGEPGFSRPRSSPIRPVISERSAVACSGAPRARSSITRSSMLTAKVTPAALIACRSTGARRCGRVAWRLARGVAARSRVEAAEALAGGVAGKLDDLGRIAELAHRRRGARDVDDLVAADGNHGRPADVRPPDTTDEQPTVLRQSESSAQVQGHSHSSHGIVTPAATEQSFPAAAMSSKIRATSGSREALSFIRRCVASLQLCFTRA